MASASRSSASLGSGLTEREAQAVAAVDEGDAPADVLDDHPLQPPGGSRAAEQAGERNERGEPRRRRSGGELERIAVAAQQVADVGLDDRPAGASARSARRPAVRARAAAGPAAMATAARATRVKWLVRGRRRAGLVRGLGRGPRAQAPEPLARGAGPSRAARARRRRSRRAGGAVKAGGRCRAGAARGWRSRGKVRKRDAARRGGERRPAGHPDPGDAVIADGQRPLARTRGRKARGGVASPVAAAAESDSPRPAIAVEDPLRLVDDPAEDACALGTLAAATAAASAAVDGGAAPAGAAGGGRRSPGAEGERAAPALAANKASNQPVHSPGCWSSSCGTPWSAPPSPSRTSPPP